MATLQPEKMWRAVSPGGHRLGGFALCGGPSSPRPTVGFHQEVQVWHAVVAGASETQSPLLGPQSMVVGVVHVWFNDGCRQQGWPSGWCRLNPQLHSSQSCQGMGPLQGHP